jgi:hypothetical protein
VRFAAVSNNCWELSQNFYDVFTIYLSKPKYKLYFADSL